jgi:hypothetical protein
MKRFAPAIVAIAAVAGGLAGGGAVPAARAVVPAAGSWGRAIEVPGLGALNTGGDAQVTSVSCTSAGSCAAGGYYTSRRLVQQGFTVAERRGRWGKAAVMPGLGALNTGGDAQVASLSCTSAGSCAAGGFYSDRSGNGQGFVADERHGRWAKAIGVPGLAALNKDPGGYNGINAAQVTSVSCAGAGDCAAGGYYTDSGGALQGFAVAERNGRWAKAIEVPGLGALNKDGQALVNSVSCTRTGDCAAGGIYADSQGGDRGFVALDHHGAWGKAIQVPGLAALRGAQSFVNSVSCAPAGSCVAGGIYLGPGAGKAFVVTERNGRWAKATGVPGRAARNGEVNSVSCASPGDCAAGGAGHGEGFVAAERHGRWGIAIQVPGLHVLGSGSVSSVSCASAGRCAAAGWWFRPGRSELLRAFVASQVNGRWGAAIRVPGLAALDKGTSQPFAQVTFYPVVSCAPAGPCIAGGAYTDASGHAQGYLTQAR